MKKIFYLLLLFLLLIIPTRIIYAQSTFDSQQKIVSLSKTEVVNKDYFAAGDVVEVSGTVNGDVYAFGRQVIVDGNVNGDVIAAGGTVNISGKVASNVRAAGGQVTISGEVGRNLSVAGGTVNLLNTAALAGNVFIAGGNVSIASSVSGDVKVGAGDLTVSGKIGGDMDVSVETLSLTDKSQVGGNVNYRSDENAAIAQGAMIGGKVTKGILSGAPWYMPGGNSAQVASSIWRGGRVFSLILTLILGSILVHFFPKFMDGGVEKMTQNPWGALGRGFLLFIFIPVIMVLFAITIIGIPIALTLLFIYLLVVYLARMITIFWLGIFISEKVGKMERDVLAFVIGLVAYTILRYIPYISGLTGLGATFFGLGAAWILFRNRNQVVRKITRRK